MLAPGHRGLGQHTLATEAGTGLAEKLLNLLNRKVVELNAESKREGDKAEVAAALGARL